MSNSTYNKMRAIYALFVFNFVLCALFFIPFYEAAVYKPIGHLAADSQEVFLNRFTTVYNYYFVVYTIMSFIYCYSFINLKLYNRSVKGYAMRWFRLFIVLFLVGLFLFSINKYYWGFWNHFSIPLWLLNVFADYVLDILSIYIRPILYWMVTTAVATFIFVRLGLAPDVEEGK